VTTVPIIMGSKADLEQGEAIAKELASYGVASELRVASAHKAARYLLELLEAYENAHPHSPRVYITIAGRSNALSGMVDAHVAAPVIACPPYSDRFGGADLYSSLRMPSGVAPAVVLEAKGAALLAAKIIGTTDSVLRARVKEAQGKATEQIISDDGEVVSSTARPKSRPKS
jgi:5-(carboxyamino)imidazole ribonucleotide mutase/phosphoribosylaminoimidazole-succinocarboxamide synthase